jgi:hypothetical protein
MPTYRLQLSHDADELVEFDVSGHPPTVLRYSVVLRHLDQAGNATAVRVYDNSHEPSEHHMHRCDRERDVGGSHRNSSTGGSLTRLSRKRVSLSRTALRR